MNVGGRGDVRMDQSNVLVVAYTGFHPVVPVVDLLGLVYLLISLPLNVLWSWAP
jgi:hypothetical protein